MWRWIFRPASRFKVGESVQLVSGNELMVVTKIYKESKIDYPLIECVWFEAHSKTSRRGIFSEEQLIPFDWTKVRTIS